MTDASSVPIGQTVIVTDNDYIKTTFTRIGHNEGIIEQFDPTSKRLVLRAQVEVFSGEQVFEYADPTFWTISINGLPIAELPDVSNARCQINVQARTIKITTR